jgi:hypothetical protein
MFKLRGSFHNGRIARGNDQGGAKDEANDRFNQRVDWLTDERFTIVSLYPLGVKPLFNVCTYIFVRQVFARH